MIRLLFTPLLLVSAGTASGGDEDPIKESLVAAKKTYDADLKELRKLATEWFDKREESARNAGNKKLVDQIKTEREAFDDWGELPKSAPAQIPVKRTAANKALESAYRRAVKDYIKAKKDDQAAAVEAELNNIVAQFNAINLLALVNPKAHTLAGEWKKEGSVLVGTSMDKPARLQLPYEPGEEYDIEIRCRRLTGDSRVCIGLVAGGRQVLAELDGWGDRGYCTGLDLIDGKSVSDNVTTVKGQLLKDDRAYTLTCSVRSGKIDMLVNGKTVMSYKGEFSRLSLWKEYTGPNTKALFLLMGVKSSSQIDRIAVVPIKGKGTVLK